MPITPRWERKPVLMKNGGDNHNSKASSPRALHSSKPKKLTRRLPRLSATQPFLVLSRNVPPHSEEERCVTHDDTKNGCVAYHCHTCLNLPVSVLA